jgi:hypothetical protein
MKLRSENHSRRKSFAQGRNPETHGKSPNLGHAPAVHPRTASIESAANLSPK